MAKPTPNAKKPTPRVPAIAIPYATLRELLGKSVNDPAVAVVIARAGKVKVDSDFIVAKEAGFDFALERPAGAKPGAKKLLATLFLFADGKDGHREFADLPAGFAFTTRAALLARLPPPALTWNDDGEAPVTAPDAHADQWTLDGVQVRTAYRGGVIDYITVSLPEEAMGGRSLADHPLHFATRPADAPPDAELVGMALLVAWAADRFGLPARHAGTPLGAKLAARAITPRTFLTGACTRTLTTLDVHPKLGDFLWGYTHAMHGARGGEDPRATAAPAIQRLLGLERDDKILDRIAYTDDFLGTFRTVVDSPFHVPDSWEAVDRLAPVLDARWADFEATGFRAPPDLALYERAATLRDAHAIAPDRVVLAAPIADPTLADDLVALIGRPLADKAVKAVLGRAGLPVGKRIDQQANPALGVAYMGTRFEIDGRTQLGVHGVWFYASKYRTYIRGIGAEIEFRGYPGPLPHGLVLGSARAAVAAILGAPTRPDTWQPAGRTIGCKFEDDKLVMISVG